MEQQHVPSAHRRNRRWTMAVVVVAALAIAGGIATVQWGRGAPDPAAAEQALPPPPARIGSAAPGLSAGPSQPAPSSSVSDAPSAPAKSKSPSPNAAPRGRCALPAYPTSSCTGVPAGWKPRKTHNGTLTITKRGTTIENYLVTGSISVRAANVKIRNTRVYGGIDNFVGDRIYGPLLMENVEAVNPPGQEFTTNGEYAIGVASFTCRRCKIVNRIEGFRVGASSYAGAGPVIIEDSFVQLAVPPGMCETDDPHGDGVQGYGAPSVTVRHNTIDQRLDNCPTAPIFIPDAQGNNGGVVDHNLLAGGGYSLRLGGGPFTSVSGNKIVDGTPGYGPVEVDCDTIDRWEGNAVVAYDWATGTIRREVKKLSDCG